MFEAVANLKPPRVLRLIVALRWCAAVLLVAALLAARLLTDSPPSMLAFLVPAILAGWNLVTPVRHGDSHEGGEAGIAVQLAVDAVALTALLYFTGGAGSPFTSLYLVPIAIAAVATRPALAWLTTTWSALCYSALLWLQPGWSHGGGAFFQMHVLGMWGNLLLTAALLTAALTALAAALRRRERELARVREQQLRDQHIVATGALAAGAAHDLNTPLGTMAVLTGELRRRPELGAQAHADLDLLASQIDECKRRIATLLQRAESEPQATTLPALVREQLARWQRTRPDVRLHLAQAPSRLPAIPVREHAALSQALFTLLDNAADASGASSDAAQVTLRCGVEDDQLTIAVEDDGGGLSPIDIHLLGRRVRSGKPDGFGLGLHLARHGLRHLGGDIQLSSLQPRGLCARLTLPLQALAPCAS